MLEKFLEKSNFESMEDFRLNYKVKVPDNFNFAYDVVDEWARIAPGKPALLWTDEYGTEHQFTFSDIKDASYRTSSFFSSLGIGRGDKVMLILNRAKKNFAYNAKDIHGSNHNRATCQYGEYSVEHIGMLE